MSGLPLLKEQDSQEFKRVLDEFLESSKALHVMLLERAGYIIVKAGESPEVDAEEFSSLASNAFNAIEWLAESPSERDFKVLHQRGGQHQTLMFRVGTSCLLVAICPSESTIDEIKSVAWPAVEQLEA
ncbi:MAG: hypothetical protein CMO80_17550 [Verrucomicrobiales bacterium]|nr:hypothetical protein [Verrucomicrobiales bacterium]|tara:strand:- start:95 stop:478 length:384 start_codon:yes stop_codon:yes gene_type:complete